MKIDVGEDEGALLPSFQIMHRACYLPYEKQNVHFNPWPSLLRLWNPIMYRANDIKGWSRRPSAVKVKTFISSQSERWRYMGRLRDENRRLWVILRKHIHLKFSMYTITFTLCLIIFTLSPSSVYFFCSSLLAPGILFDVFRNRSEHFRVWAIDNGMNQYHTSSINAGYLGEGGGLWLLLLRLLLGDDSQSAPQQCG